MTICYGDKTACRVDDIESGVIFQYSGEFYITTTKFNYDTEKRTCVNVALGTLYDIPLHVVVEFYYNSYITIKGGK